MPARVEGSFAKLARVWVGGVKPAAFGRRLGAREGADKLFGVFGTPVTPMPWPVLLRTCVALSGFYTSTRAGSARYGEDTAGCSAEAISINAAIPLLNLTFHNTSIVHGGPVPRGEPGVASRMCWWRCRLPEKSGDIWMATMYRCDGVMDEDRI
jgi:hypothetical protein